MLSFPFRLRCLTALLLLGAGPGSVSAAERFLLPEEPPLRPGLRAGAAAVDVSPRSFPVIVNGGFLQATANRVNDPLHARCLVLEDGTMRLAITVVDSCMMPRELIDRAKEIAKERTGIPTDRMLISATHTHTAPSVMGALGTPVDPGYAAELPARVAEAIVQAAANVAPARAGWGVILDDRHTHCRRWIRRPDRLVEDPFGRKTARANMHPGYVNPDAIAPSGPVDPALTMLSIQTTEGRPIAVLANYSQHYFGSEPVSADYYGRFASALARKITGSQPAHAFVGIMSQGTSGDQMWMDYGRPQENPGLDRYSEEVAESAYQAYRAIDRYDDRATLAMAETTITLGRRLPDEARLAWARPIVAQMGDRVPRTLPEVYAREAIHLHDEPERTLKLQAIRIGELGIAAIPNEVYALTGLKIKARSPLPLTMNIELANGSEGYIPPPEQHVLGGYTTWPARTAGLEVRAEPKIVASLLGLLEQVAGKPRRHEAPAPAAYTRQILASRPFAYWRLEELDGTVTRDASGLEHAARLEPGVALYLPGADLPGLRTSPHTNRAPHLAGGRITATLALSPEAFSAELWFWNGLPADAREVTGILFERSDKEHAIERLELQRAPGASPACVLTLSQAQTTAAGKTTILPRSWHHVVLVRTGQRVDVHLDGHAQPEARIDLDTSPAPASASLFSFGGPRSGENSLEGKIDEISLYDRSLTAAEIAEHFRAAVNPGPDGAD